MKSIQKALVQRGDRFLIILRSPKAHYFPNHWDFPGGTLEHGEDPLAGVEREVKEETGLTVEALKVVGVVELDLDSTGHTTHMFTLYATRVVSGDVTLSHEHTDFRWATREEILQLNTEPFMKTFFQQRPHA